MNTRHGLMMGGLILLGLLTLGAKGESGGCGGSNFFEGMADKDSRVAKIEDARIALDTRDFTKTIDILTEFCGSNRLAPTCDSKTASLWAAGFCGRAGMDSIKLINVAAAAASASGGFTPARGITTVSQVIPTTTQAGISDLRDCSSISSATATTAEQRVQVAVATAGQTIALLGSFVGNFTSAGIPNNFANRNELQIVATLISESVLLMSQSLANAALPNADLTKALESFKVCIGFPPTGESMERALNSLKASSGSSCT